MVTMKKLRKHFFLSVVIGWKFFLEYIIYPVWFVLWLFWHFLWNEKD